MMLLRALCVAAAAAVAPHGALAQSNAEKGYQIAKASQDRDTGYRDYTVSGKMVLRDSTGRESGRRFDLKLLEGSGGDKSLLVFNWPGDIRDTALLTHAFTARDDNQWLYLPSVNRAKRISGSNRSGSFVGSEFSYEDMVNQDIDKFSHEWRGDEPCPTSAQLTCHVVDRVPRYQSGYSRQRVWFDSRELRVFTVQYYDRGGNAVKTLTAAGFKLYNGKYWRAGIMRMQNHLTKKSSDLIWTDYRFGVGLSDGQFSVNALRNLG